MNCKEAFEIMEIDMVVNHLTIEQLKKQYRKLALLNHPDKCGNTLESTEKFQKIQEAYHFLQKEIKEFIEPESSLYMDILKIFLKTIERNYDEVILNVISEILYNCKNVSLRLFDNIDKESCIYIYQFLSNHRSILHLSQDFLETIQEMLIKKFDNISLYKLNPNIDDLLDNNVYKLYVDNTLYLVPLWYNEMCFDGVLNEIIVICEPELEGIIIDDDNNIYVEITILGKDIPSLIFENKSINVPIGKKNFSILVSELNLKREQIYKIKNKGISRVKNDIYDISEKADIIVKILISF